MRFLRVSLVLIALLLPVVWLLGGCSDDDDPASPGDGGDEDTTAPQIVGLDPESSETGVAVDHPITITFNEDMDPATADGAVSVTPGGVTGLTWSDARNLVVSHADWLEGATVTLAVGPGLADVAGNPLGGTTTTTFYVMASDLVLVSTDPVDGATDVSRSAVIALLFSAPMDQTSVQGAITVTADGGDPLPCAITASDVWVRVDPDGDLPADAAIAVAISTAAQDEGGRNLASEASFTFTTGQDVDTTPPTITAITPADGATVGIDQPYFRVTFSEPVDPDTADPVRVNAELFALAEAAGITPVWSDGNTVWTVSLPNPLPTGLPLSLVFRDYADVSGNVQTVATTWNATVEGTADYYPLVDGRQFVYATAEEGGPVGEDPTWSDTGESYVQFDAQSGGAYHRAWYDPGFTTTGDWDVMQHAGGALEYLGFHETDEGTETDVIFDDPLTFVTLPPAGSWSDATSATVPGEGTFDLAGEGRFVEQLDLEWLPGGDGHPALFWKNVRLVVIEHTISAGTDIMETGVDSLWLAPTVGIVKYGTSGEDVMEDQWYRERGTLLPPNR